MPITSSSHYRKPPPPPSSAAEIQSDAPALAPLNVTNPDLHIYTSSSPSFESLRHLLEQTVNTPPLAVIRPTSEAEVVATVKFCKHHAIPLSIRSGGLDIGARSRMSDPAGVMLDVRSLDAMSVDTDSKTARVGGGVLCESLLQFLDEHALTTPTAFLGAVGYTAFACGGGYGLLSGTKGLGADNILAARLILASGEVVDTADAGSDPEIFWALRGCGGGILGVVTELRVRVHARPPCLGGFIMFPVAEAPAVMDFLKAVDAEVSSGKLAGDMMVVNTPGLGTTLTYIYFWALDGDKGDLQEAKGYLKRICDLGNMIANTVTETTPWEFTAKIPNPVAENRLSFKVYSRSVDSYSTELGRIIAAHPIPNDSSAIVIHNCHGAAVQPRPDASFANRRNHLLLGVSANGPVADMEARPEVRGWSAAIGEDIKKAGLEQDWAYVNFTQPVKGNGRLFYGVDGAQRLRSLKHKLDPDDFFKRSLPDLEV